MARRTKGKNPEEKYYAVLAAEEKALARLIKLAKRLSVLRKKRRYYEKQIQAQYNQGGSS